MQRTSVNPSEWSLAFAFDQGEVITGGTRHLRCSGQVPLKADPDSELGISVEHVGDLAGQMTTALANIDGVLEKAGMARENIVFLRFFTTDVDGFLANYGIYAEWISAAGIRPPQSLLGISRLALPEMMVEIEAEAVA